MLRFSGTEPGDSDSIWWDERVIDEDTLTATLSFELDPDTLRPLDLRNHHTSKVKSRFLQLVLF